MREKERQRGRNEGKQKKTKTSPTSERGKKKEKKETHDRKAAGGARKGERVRALERAREKGTCNNTTKGGFARGPLLAGVKSEMTTRTLRASLMTYSDNRVPVQPGYDTVNSARFVAALFSRGREAEESE